MGLPPGLPEGALLAVLVGAGALVVRSVRRRRAFLKAASDTDLPDLETEIRLRVQVRRLWQDPQQQVPLVEVSLDRRRFVFCPVDHAARSAEWGAQVGKEVEIGLYGLATLAPGGAEAMRDRIKDADQLELGPDFVTLVREGQFPNDFVVIGRVLSVRDAAWGSMPLRVYRVQCVHAQDLTLVLEMGVPRDDGPVLEDGAMTHGSVRLFGYLA